jgi:hypothetical protein
MSSKTIKQIRKNRLQYGDVPSVSFQRSKLKIGNWKILIRHGCWRVGLAYPDRICCSPSLHAVVARAVAAPQRCAGVRCAGESATSIG